MRRILFVDDEANALEDLRRILRPHRDEWEIAFAQSGEAALALLDATAFDAIVSDMRMPGMDGAALLSRVRDRHPQTVRIVISSHPELSTALRVVPVAHQFLSKPCDPKTLRVAVERACHLRALLTDESIRRTIGELGDLPALPRTYEALTRTLADPDVSLARVGKLVEQDVGISAKVLQLVNSAFFGVAHSITNVQSAVSYLGINTLKSLVLSVEIFRAFRPKGDLPGFSLEKLQQHAQMTAFIAARLPVPKHLTDIAMVAGMLHDVGKLILAWKRPEQLKKFLMAAAENKCPIHQIEQKEMGFSHAEIGGYLLGLWGLPYTIVEAVALHHTPRRMPHQHLDAITAIFTADLLAHDMEGDASEASNIYQLDNFKDDLTALEAWDLIPEARGLAKEFSSSVQVEA